MFQATVYNVMIASPGDVPNERQIVREVIFDWNAMNAASKEIVLLPVGWETHSYPAMSGHPQTVLNEQILASCDLLVAIFGSRIGTPTVGYVSGTVEEIETHLNSEKPAMLYFSSGPVSRENLDLEQYKQLEEFRQSCQDRGLYQVFVSEDDFRIKFTRQLNLTVTGDKYFLNNYSYVTSGQMHVGGNQDRDTLPGMQPAVRLHSDEAKTLLKEAIKDPNGHILCHRTGQGTTFLANKQEFVSEDPRTQAAWENGFEELENLQLIKAQSTNRIAFSVTTRGYDLADEIE